jgi:hypothetical protein
MSRHGARRRNPRLILALAAGAAVAALLPAAQSATAATRPSKALVGSAFAHARILGAVPHHAAAGHVVSGGAATGPTENRVCQGCTPPLLPGDRTVMGTASTPGENTQYAIYWTGEGAIPSSYQATINAYLTDVAAASGSITNVYSTDNQYTGASSYLSHFTSANAILDTNSTTRGCTPDPSYSECLTDAQVEQEILNVINARNLAATVDMAHMFLMFLPPGVEICATTNTCSASVFCGYHSGFQFSPSSPIVLYSAMPYATLQGCASGQQPNGDPYADGEIDTLSHEVNETITDPLGSSWADSGGNEDGDECSNIYGTPFGTQTDTANSTQYNQVINGHRYYTQEEFSNAAFNSTGAGCIQAAGQAAPPTNSVTVGVSRSQVPNDGSSTSQVTATVMSPPPAQPVSGDEVDFSTFAKAGNCGTVSPTKATTNSSGQASTTYTASTDNVPCTIIATELARGAAGAGVIDQGVPGTYHPLAPFRLADTRAAAGTYAVDAPALGPADTRLVPVRGQDGVPADASAAVLNVTAAGPSASGFLTAYPGGGAVPATSNLNFVAGQTVANLVTVPIGTDGGVGIYNLAGTTNVVVDLEGYMEPGSATSGLLNTFSPSRIADTRAGSGQPASGQTLSQNGVLAVQVNGAGGVPSNGVSAVVLNVTAVNGTSASYLTAYAHGSSKPTASNLNFKPGQVVPNRVVVPVANGSVDIYNLAGNVDVVVDVAGWFSDGNATTTGARFTPVVPTRVADTRAHSGEQLSGRTLGPARLVAVPVAETSSSPGLLPAGVAAVAGNVTVADTSDASYLTVYPDGAGRPVASDLNWTAGQVVANQVITQLGSDGALAIYNNSGSTDVIVDIFGYWA